ncbi:hypothetical protein ABIE64_001427 [Thalassospira sp. MBR-102]|jgi:hypothetical protein|uniref:hypothetical protein n=1 Tax=Thalassospira TaxID=168934 RepID=UPI0008DD1FC6|nr:MULTISPECIES: hypothetical protein [Thalassospira]MAB34177.1 hypothetical protein [Thalassospira sp.]MDM7978297.1 hypothetical protein [Thalassospira xiamenensis]OHZ01025.1 hypothetical protein BC440_09325 [Thalassospira sp. MIT1004]HBS24757.1 hypothetical protein [Thalassospira sp.]|tara:strand:+ start:1380 stop:1601 length:222 start_codon:yes stop_codon:yes gene_type:complete
MRTIYQSTDDNGHTLRALKLSKEGHTSPVYLGLVIHDGEVLFRTRENSSREFVLQKIKEFVAAHSPTMNAQPA